MPSRRSMNETRFPVLSIRRNILNAQRRKCRKACWHYQTGLSLLVRQWDHYIARSGSYCYLWNHSTHALQGIHPFSIIRNKPYRCSCNITPSMRVKMNLIIILNNFSLFCSVTLHFDDFVRISENASAAILCQSHFAMSWRVMTGRNIVSCLEGNTRSKGAEAS